MPQKTPSIDFWGSIFEAYSCKRPVLRQISKNQTANDFRFPRSDRSEQFEDLRSIIFTDECLVYLSVPGNRKNDASGPNRGQKWNPFKISSLLQKSWFGAQWQLQMCPSYMYCLQTKLWEQSISKRAFSLYFYLMIWIRPVILEKLQKEDLWKHVGFDIVAERSISFQGDRNSKSDLKQFFSVLNQRLMTPKHAWPVSHRKYVWNFQCQGGNVKTLLQEPGIDSGQSGSLQGND